MLQKERERDRERDRERESFLACFQNATEAAT